MDSKAVQSIVWMKCVKAFIAKCAFKSDVRAHVQVEGIDRLDCFVVVLCIRRPGIYVWSADYHLNSGRCDRA